MSVKPNLLARKLPTGYLLAFGILSIILAGIAAYVVTTQTAFKSLEIPVIVVMAILVILIQAVVFMNLGNRKVYPVFFAYGAFLALIIAVSPQLIVTAEPLPPSSKVTPSQELAIGKQIVTQTCVSCHIINGTGGTIGPNLNQVFAGKVSASLLAPTSDPNNPTWLAQWIADPANVWSGAKMPNLGLSAPQIQGVVMYLDQDVK